MLKKTIPWQEAKNVCVPCVFWVICFYIFKVREREESEMAQWLRTEETHMAAHDCLQLQF